MNRYYSIVEEKHDYSGVLYSFAIKWNIDVFTKELGENGFIVQKVSVENNTGASIGFKEDYYEAWKVENGSIESQAEAFDDRFIGYPSWLCESAQADVKKRPSYIKYNCIVFWVDIKDSAYEEVNKWQKQNSNAGDLRSCLVKKCKVIFETKVTDRHFKHDIL